MDMYDFVSYEKHPEIRQIIDNIKIIRKEELDLIDNLNDDGQAQFVNLCYNPIQHFGGTDYTDHRKTDTKILAEKILKNMKFQSWQRGHFYDSRRNPVETLVIKGYNGGYTGWFIYKNGKNGFERRQK